MISLVKDCFLKFYSIFNNIYILIFLILELIAFDFLLNICKYLFLLVFVPKRLFFDMT
jgi:hypothetical protein